MKNKGHAYLLSLIEIEHILVGAHIFQWSLNDIFLIFTNNLIYSFSNVSLHISFTFNIRYNTLVTPKVGHPSYARET